MSKMDRTGSMLQVTKHKEKQFYAAITDIPRQIIANQSIEGVDAVTGATVTSRAIVNATAKALAGGNR
ncbi:MAG: FMN-binding protein [Planctomycetaceae bacterium]|nr:FMN-binding protein [Planctomycetaceae bacterium]